MAVGSSLGFDLQGPAQKMGEFLTHRQTQTSTTVLSCVTKFRLAKGFKNQFQTVFRNPFARVLNTEFEPGRVVVRTIECLYVQGNHALLSKLDGIGHQVVEKLLQSRLVTVNLLQLLGLFGKNVSNTVFAHMSRLSLFW